MRRWRRGITGCLVTVGCMVAGFVIPALVVSQVIVWAAPDQSHTSDMGLGLYAFFLGSIAGLIGMVVAAVLTARWFTRP